MSLFNFGSGSQSKLTAEECGLRFRFQPVYVPAEEKIFGYECLLRVVDPNEGELEPAAFLRVAKTNPPLITRLEDWAIEELVVAANELNGRNMRFKMLSVNIDSDSLFGDDFIDRMVRNLGDGYGYDNIWFEFKPEILDNQDAEQNLVDLRALGIKVIIDNFTEEYLSQLYLPIDMIKISLDYVSDFLVNPVSRQKIESILEVAKLRKLEVTALGVENATQERALIDMGCTKMQGYYYSKPLLLKNPKNR